MKHPLRDPQFRAEIEAARLRGWWVARALQPRCCALRSNGQPCRQGALPGQDRCHYHAPSAVARARRERGQGASNPSREHTRQLRRAWAVSPWCPGWTVQLPLTVEAVPGVNYSERRRRRRRGRRRSR